ncbi:diguanylate cyclase [Caminibacter mediatlanticus TB-2]|uniref:Diguanylate cyclase n=1 Tax=Caminibacter mediatlanticus TB-2 TaxID=391592 RepID=A0ABX5V7K0_9BACT|nr:diguanylate cyclase [Caminibacter mediatlanticus]QCT94265.1 diguanylate cyclase [Caminibacter mediatlanticus TB-2]
MKKKILIIIALIMIISTIIRTSLVEYSFIAFAKQLILNQTMLIKDILYEVINKEDYLQIIKDSYAIEDIKLKKGKIKSTQININLKQKYIQIITPFNSESYLDIKYNAKDYFNNILNISIKLFIIGLTSLIIIIWIVNYFLTPYLEILENVKKSTKEISKGNFDKKITTKLKGEAKEFVNNYNKFLEDLKNSFGVIEEKYTSLIEKEKSQNPLEDAKNTISQLADIFKFKKVIEEDISTEVVLNRLIEIIKKFNIKHFALFGIDNTKKTVIFEYNEGDICCDIKDKQEFCRAYRTKNIIKSSDFPNICQRHFCKNSYICIPFSKSGNFTGILKIMDIEHIDKDTIAYIKAYLKEVSSIVESKFTLELLHNQTIIDPLTKLYNRRFLENILNKIIANADRTNQKVAFVMIDMDYFKKVNDTYGHDVGDMILKHLANILKSSIRESDIVVRFGGEEFLIILNNIKDKECLFKTLEKIRKKIEEYEFKIPQGKIKKTISMGASLYPDTCNSPWQCIKNADIALYKAKNSGRNKIVIFEN